MEPQIRKTPNFQTGNDARDIPICPGMHFDILENTKMANVAPDYDKATEAGEDVKVKIICLGDSAVGKSK